MKKKLFHKYIVFVFIFISSASLSQVKNNTTVVRKTHKTVNTYQGKKQKEADKTELKIVFSDRVGNSVYEEPFGAKVINTVEMLSAMYVIDQDKNYYEVVVADEKMIGKPKGFFSVLRSKKTHFKDSKEVKYLGWIKKENVIEYSRPKQNQVNLKYVKYFVASNTVSNLLSSTIHLKKESLVLKNDPNLESTSRKKIKLNDFVYLYKINETTQSAFVSNFDNLIPKDTANLKYGWVPLQYLNAVQDNMIVKLDNSDTVNFSSNKMKFKASELYKNSFFINENQTSTPIKFSVFNSILIPTSVWNHDKNKITNLKGEDISIKTIEQIAIQSKNINFYYVFENTAYTKAYLKKTLSALQNLKLTISKEQYSNYNFTYSFISKGTNENFYLNKSTSFSKWFDLIEKSIKTPNEIKKENISRSNYNNISQFFNSESNYENNFFIIAGLTNSINYTLPDNFNLLARNNSKLLFIIFSNENNASNQDFISQSKMYLNEASIAHKKYLYNYYVDPKLISKNDELTYNGEYDNDYIYDAPSRSNFNGGIIFPKLNEELTMETINYAIDSVITKTIRTNKTLLKSLTEYKNEFSFLRSVPSDKIKQYIADSKLELNSEIEIAKNYRDENLIITSKDTLAVDLESKVHILLTQTEIKQLIENYRELISKDYTHENIDKVEISSFKKRCKMFAKNIKKTEEFIARSSIADLLYFNTRVFVTSPELHKLRIRDIRKFKKIPENFKILFVGLNAKLEVLEMMQRNNSFEVFDEQSETKYYCISKKLLL